MNRLHSRTNLRGHRVAGRRLAVESLEHRQLLTSLAFQRHDILETDHVTNASTVDIDSDGDLDILWSSYRDGDLAWYENMDGRGTFGARHLIDDGAPGGLGGRVQTADLDGDGDLDVVTIIQNQPDTNTESQTLVWYENLDGLGTFSERQTTAASARYFRAWVLDDLNGDGAVDLIASEGGSPYWQENIGGLGIFAPAHTIDAGHTWALGLGDADGDGDLDVFANGNNQTVWYENTDGAGAFAAPQPIAESPSDSLLLDDLNGDGHIDLITEYGWHENSDGLGNFGLLQPLSRDPFNTLYSFADLDSDNDLDALRHGRSTIVWQENMNGEGEFGPGQAIIDWGARSRSSSRSSTGDLDGDGDLDIVVFSTTGEKLAWFRNTDGRGTFGEPVLILASASGARSVQAGDIDGDGDEDAVSVSGGDGRIAWYENTDGEGSFGDQLTIAVEDGAAEARIADVDADGDPDIVALLFERRRVDIVWFENADGSGNFGGPKYIASMPGYYSYSTSLEVADVDGDGDFDVMAFDLERLSWFENTDGNGTYGIGAEVTVNELVFMQVVDIDNDADPDVLSVTKDGDVLLHENRQGLFETRRLSSASEPRPQSVHAADLDGDDDFDIVTVSGGQSKRCQTGGAGVCTFAQTEYSWYENTGQLVLGPKHILAITPRVGGHYNRHRFTSKDIDGDGDTDLVAFSSVGGIYFWSVWESDDKIFWFENLNGTGRFATERVLTTDTNGLHSFDVVDLDRDGDADVLTASAYDGKIAWFESNAADQQVRIPGDADGNAEVEFSDFLLLSKNFGKQADAVWADGDFNEDGKVEFADFLILAENYGKTSQND